MLKEVWKEPKEYPVSVISNMLATYAQLEVAKDIASTKKVCKANMKKWYDQKTRERKFIVDDLVLLLLPFSANKLLEKCQGPFPIAEVLSPTTYTVRMSGLRKPLRTYHVNMLARYESPSAVCLCSIATEPHILPYGESPTWSATHISKPPKTEPEGRATSPPQRLCNGLYWSTRPNSHGHH